MREFLPVTCHLSFVADDWNPLQEAPLILVNSYQRQGHASFLESGEDENWSPIGLGLTLNYKNTAKLVKCTLAISIFIDECLKIK